MKTGVGAADMQATNEDKADGDTCVMLSDVAGGEGGITEIQFSEIENMFRGDGGKSTVANDLLQHINTKVTNEGLIIGIFDLPSSPLFITNTE